MTKPLKNGRITRQAVGCGFCSSNFKEDLLMNKAELVAAVAEKTGFTKKDAELAVNAFVSSVEGALVN